MEDAVDSLFRQSGFGPAVYVKDRPSIADLFRPDRRCGLYVLHFEDGWHYAGQAVDVVRRYAQHRHTHSDIEFMSFQPMAKHRLSENEKALIATLEKRGIQIRNISLVSTPQIVGETDFDLLMAPEAQRRWAENTLVSFGSADRASDPVLRSRYHARYQKFMRLPDAERALLVLQTYAQMSLPIIRGSERLFGLARASHSIRAQI